MREYIDGGYNIIYAHGNQFIASALELAAEFPEVAFVLENDGPVADAPANVWVIDRMFNVPYYVLGYIAARSTQTGKIAYLGGLELPFAYQELHAIDQALADNNLEVEINRVFTGDFNDPTKGRQFADQLIADGNDYIMGSMNLGMFGLFEAAKAASTDTKKILTSAKYTDKKSFAPNNYVTSCLYDFATPVKFAVEKILTGELGGYTQIAFGSGVKIQQPLMNVDPALDAEVTQMVEDITSGKIEVVKDSSKYE
jgi:basic membrane protein A